MEKSRIEDMCPKQSDKTPPVFESIKRTRPSNVATTSCCVPGLHAILMIPVPGLVVSLATYKAKTF